MCLCWGDVLVFVVVAAAAAAVCVCRVRRMFFKFFISSPHWQPHTLFGGSMMVLGLYVAYDERIGSKTEYRERKDQKPYFMPKWPKETSRNYKRKDKSKPRQESK